MKLKKLLKDLPITHIKGSKELEITGVCANSKLVSPGNLFIARKGRADDGMHFIPEAVDAGAIVILTEVYDPLLDKSITQVIHPNVASLESIVAATYHNHPAKELLMVGITGTNGKTTTSFIMKYLLDRLDNPCGLIGTIEYIIGTHRYQAVRTTPDASSTQKMLREMANNGCRSAIMEITSHALDQKNRVDHIDFDVAVFTNLSVDHLDYHVTMDNYAEAKNKLFLSLNSSKEKPGLLPKKLAIVNIDSPWHKKIIQGCSAGILTYGIINEADLQATDISLSTGGTTFTLVFRGKKKKVSFPLVGSFNVYNCLASIAVALSRNIELDAIVDVLETVPAVPGRLEAVPNPLDLKIYVDFAHSDDALLNVLNCLKEFKVGKLIVVFGCGGNRDASKRPLMAKVCENHADVIIVTSDNPRNENPDDIIQNICSGFSKNYTPLIEPDRMAAIKKAIDIATPNDIILVAGKGHESQQIFAHKTIEFDDRKVVRMLCQNKFNLKTAYLPPI